MPLAGREILPRDAYGYIYEEVQQQGIPGAAIFVARNLLATAMFEAGGYSKIRDAARKVLREKGTPEASLPPRYYVLYSKATYTNSDGSEDRGMFMINDRWHPDVTDEQAFDPEFAANYAVKLYKTAGMSPWYGWRDIMSPNAIKAMREDPDNPFKSHLAGAENRWQRAMLASGNYELDRMGLKTVSVASLA